MAKKIKVGVIFGGRSGEHEVSLRSVRSVIEALDRKKYELVPLAITREGRWLPPAESAGLLPAATQRLLDSATGKREGESSAPATSDSPETGLVSLGGDAPAADRFDVVIPVLHGTYGEDGTIQGLLEMAGVPYVGCGVLASSCGMDKVTMKSLFRDAGLPICKYVWFLRSEWESDARAVARRVARELGFPCFVKPANLGSSVGISRADDRASLQKAVELAARYDRKIIVEEAVNGREIECAVMGNDDPEASLPGEYVVLEKGAEFLDYTEKYSSTGHVDFIVPAKLSKRQTTLVRQLAVRSFKALDCSGLTRVDFFLKRDTNELFVNELNTMPGLTDVSGYPKMWEASGMPFSNVLDRLIELAFERHGDRKRNAVSL
jgi:D-alanine-D-alanine ligase